VLDPIIIAAAIKAAGDIVGATKREGSGSTTYSAQEDGRNAGACAAEILKTLQARGQV
jgi:hypothetical protein